MDDFGRMLKGERKRAHLTQAQLARSSGVPRGTIAALESSSESNPRWETVLSLARALGVSLDRLAGLRPAPERKEGAAQRLGRVEEHVALLRQLPRQVAALAEAVGTLSEELQLRDRRQAGKGKRS